MQVGEYELTITDVTFIVFLLVILKKLYKWATATKIEPPKKFDIPKLSPIDLTLKEVKKMRKEDNRCLVVVNQKIYDLSSSRDLYENNRDIFEAEEVKKEDWESICDRKYPYIGKILAEN